VPKAVKLIKKATTEAVNQRQQRVTERGKCPFIVSKYSVRRPVYRVIWLFNRTKIQSNRLQNNIYPTFLTIRR